MKKIPDEEDKKTVMLMENRKRKGRLGSGALGPNSDPNPEENYYQNETHKVFKVYKHAR